MRKMSLVGPLMSLAVAWACAHGQAEARKPMIVPGKKALPLRVLVRPFSNVYQQQDEASTKVKSNLPAFQPLYVYQRSGGDAEGWYEVGEDKRGRVLGWMKADDVMEWHQAMVMAYTHPQGRGPVLMFKDVAPLKEMIAAAADARKGKAESIYTTIDSKQIPAEFPVVSVEPKRATHLSIEEEFYLLPILASEAVEIETFEGRLLRMAAATSAKSGRGETTLQDKEFLNQAVRPSDAKDDRVKQIRVEVVYVIDLTTSMQPFVDATLKTIRSVTEKIMGDADLKENFRFGLWGYRDSMDIKDIEFLTRNFTTELQPADAFVGTLGGVKAATVGSQGFEEDMFAGVDKAMRETKWSEGALRFLVLIGDAPSHEPGHKWNSTGLGEGQLREFADANQFSLFTLLVRNPEGAKWFDPAQRQFRKLGENRGVAEPSTMIVENADEFAAASAALATTLRNLVVAARKQGDVSAAMGGELATKVASDVASDATVSAPQAQAQKEAIQETAERANEMVKAALVDYLGGAQAPRDVVAWVTDRDLKDPAVQALDVRVLVNKTQLDQLRKVLGEVLAAGRRGQMTTEDFFTALQAVSSSFSVAPDQSPGQAKDARTLAQTGLVPEFLLGLPYKSRVMAMTSEMWKQWPEDQQDKFLTDIEAMLQLYKNIHDDPKLWVKLNEGDDPDEHVYPIALDMLP